MQRVEFENLLRHAMGYDAASIGSAAVERAVKSRMATFGFKGPGEYWLHLRGSEAELQELVESVVVPETWFFRAPQAFVALVRLLTAERRAVHRLLSVPCSTGEEPYSMAMSLLDGGFLPEQFHVDAVDISARSLCSKARRLRMQLVPWDEPGVPRPIFSADHEGLCAAGATAQPSDVLPRQSALPRFRFPEGIVRCHLLPEPPDLF